MVIISLKGCYIMTNINCEACKCGYNSSGKCLKEEIDVEGLFAKSKVGTFCQSYKNLQNNPIKEMEIARELADDDLPHRVNCSANYCSFYNDGCCQNREISIGKEDSLYRSETECDSFHLK